MKHVSLLLLIGSIGFAWLNFTMLDFEKPSGAVQALYGPNAQETEALMERFVNNVLNEGRVELLDELVTEDYTAQSFDDESIIIGDRDALKRVILNAHLSDPGYHLSFSDYTIYDERVVFYWPGGALTAGGLPLMNADALRGFYGIAIYCFKDGMLNRTYFNRYYYYPSDGEPVMTSM